ncbi:MAG: hypothetical protein AAGB02_01645 [Pseudomonadota bacterium]
MTGTQIGLLIDEDVFNDAERTHIGEGASLIGFSGSFHAVFEAELTAAKTVQIIEDPVNGVSNPFAIPGARVRYTVDVTSVGDIPIDDSTVSFIDALPPETRLVVNDFAGPGSGPVRFTDSASGLTYTFSGLSSTSDSLAFSNDGGASFTYTPSAGLDGADGAVTHIRVEPVGAFSATGGGASPSFQLEFDVIVE